MTLSRATFFHLMGRGILRCASLAVPGSERQEWWREWRSELWHVRQARTPRHGISWEAEREVVAFCLGAFRDAFSLREHVTPRRARLATTMGSPTQCIVLLVCLLGVSYGAAMLLPGVAATMHASRYRDARHLMLIQNAHSSIETVPTVSALQFRSWSTRKQDLFDDLAFYELAKETLSTSSHVRTALHVARATPNLFELLGLPLQVGSGGGDRFPVVILSSEIWRRDFAGDPSVSGRVVRIGSREAVVGGVAKEGSWDLPGRVDVWLLESSPVREQAMGFVVAHLKATNVHATWGERWEMTASKPDGSVEDWSCVSLVSRTGRPWSVFVFTVLLACLALPAMTSLTLGEYRADVGKIRWRTSLRRWTFFCCKVGLLLPIVYFVSLDLSHLRMTMTPASSQYIQMLSSFSICLFGLRWVLRDQRQRCPVCLGKLTHPARVGEPSRNFLTWNGTELICAGGHGLLHIPEMPTSWFSTQRWLYLDSSWDGLFVDPGLVRGVEY